MAAGGGRAASAASPLARWTNAHLNRSAAPPTLAWQPTWGLSMCGRIRAEGQIRTIGVFLLLALAAVLTMPGGAAATPLEYTFSASNEGWLQSQNNGNTVTAAGFQSSGGNPGGRLTAKDSGAETGCPSTTPCDLLTFFSPIVSPMIGNYGGTASFDLRSSVNPGFAAEFLLLPTGPEYLDGLIPESTGTTYHHLSIQMTETANWAVCPYAGGTCATPSQSQFVSLISASDQVAVIADVGPNGTGETYDLDNVVLTDGGGLPTPPPNPGPKPHKKPKKCKKKHKKRAAVAKKCKKKRRSAAALRG